MIDTTREYVTVIMPQENITTKGIIKAMLATGIFEYQILSVLKFLIPY